MINEVVYTHAVAQTPWGGVKQSGYGRTHGRLGLLEWSRRNIFTSNRVPWLPDVWWFRYTNEAGKLFRGFARRFTTGSVLSATLLLPQIIRRLFDRRRFLFTLNGNRSRRAQSISDSPPVRCGLCAFAVFSEALIGTDF